MINDLILD